MRLFRGYRDTRCIRPIPVPDFALSIATKRHEETQKDMLALLCLFPAIPSYGRPTGISANADIRRDGSFVLRFRLAGSATGLEPRSSISPEALIDTDDSSGTR